MGCAIDVSPEEATDLSGPAAKDYLKETWPAGVNANDVEFVNLKSQSTRDSYSTWFHIKLNETAALKWADDVHSHEAAWLRSRENREGVKRHIDGPPPLHRQTGTTPVWWSPPSIEFRAIEVMLWYDDGNNGLARATYTGFDESERSLWIYRYSAQHELLWRRGHLPDGEPLELNDENQREREE